MLQDGYRIHNHELLQDMLQDTQSCNTTGYVTGYTIMKNHRICYRIHNHEIPQDMLQDTQSCNTTGFVTGYTI